MLRHIRLLILDLDYLVFDCTFLKMQALRESLISLADAIPHELRMPDPEDVEEGFRDYGFRWIAGVAQGGNVSGLDDLENAYRLHEIRLMESGVGSVYSGMNEFIRNCAGQGVLASLGADASRDYLLAVADRHQLDAIFHGTFCTEEFGAGGTDEMFAEILDHAEVHPSEAVALSVRPAVFQAAHALDMLAIGCGWGIRDHRGLAEADLLAPAISHLYAAIKQADDLASERSA